MVNILAKYLDGATYFFLALNFLWGLYCVIMGFRRVAQLNFRKQEEQTQFVDEVVGHLRNHRYKEVEDLVADDTRALPLLTQLVLNNRSEDEEQLRQIVSEMVQRDVMGDFDYRTGWIATTIKSGPLLGLFGTVVGMMAAFGRIGTGEKVQPHQIADDISIALICTAAGLLTAIPFNFMLNSLTTRIRAFQDSLSAGLVRILDSAHR